MKAAYLDVTSGIAGDMFLAALVDAGCDLERLIQDLGTLAIAHEFHLSAKRVRRGALMGTHVTVEVHEPSLGAHGRSYSAIVRLIRDSGLPEQVQDDAIAV